MSVLRLRKYVQCNWYDLVNIRYCQVCLVSQRSFNDPIESLYYDSKNHTFDGYRKILTNEEVERVRVTCFVNYDRLLRGEKKNKMGGVSRVDKSETDADEFLMWTHYANAHRGICLEFEIPDTEFDDDKFKVAEDDTMFEERNVFLQDVSYLPGMAKNFESVFSAGVGSRKHGALLQNVCFTKDAAFDHEWECRLLKYAGVDDRREHIPFEFDYLSKVIFGMRCTGETQDIVHCVIDKTYSSKTRAIEFATVNDKFKEVRA